MRVETFAFKDIELQLLHGQGLIAYLPVGCTEQHGPILPLGTDSIIAERMALDLCSKNESRGWPGVVYPTISYSPSRSNMTFSGSTSVNEDAFRQYVSETCHSIMHHAFCALVIVCMHGPAEPSVMEIVFRSNLVQFEQERAIRPYLLLGTTGCADAFRKHLSSLAGKHADFREFLLLYHVLGTEFFSIEKIQRLKSLGDTYRTSPPPARVIPGVPIRHRSFEGIIGNPWPVEEIEYASLSEALWKDILETFSATSLAVLDERGSL